MGIDRFSFPTTIHFGPGARKLVADYLLSQGLQRPLLVTDRGIAALPLLSSFLRELSGLQVGIFSDITGNPLASQADRGAEAFRAHDADSVIGFGGGAALDIAKAVALLATHPGKALEYAWDHPQVRPMDRELPCWVALPTTAGTGSEVGRSSVVSDDKTRIKKILFSPKLLAKVVFADPELTVDLPPALTAATGMDALTHNVESYLSPVYHPLCDGIAVEGTRIAARALPQAVHHGKDLTARGEMLMSSMMGAIAFQKDLGAVHACAHALSTVADLHHGLANGVMIDHVMRFNLEAAAAKMAELGRVAGVASEGSEEARANAFIGWLTTLKEQIGIPAKLGQIQGERPITREDIPALVEVASRDLCHQTNPRPCTPADFEAIFAAAL
ncbi:MAG: iron-containing alcohol dehydrogenase [Myxococcales bacterium]|nr:iron-containing alcohol dehydrogenase [Polyangiaceae bacterium]MDW8248201.1 iron-containing alcohol dehydrogenase [Myxococcales bacterium]